jgi:NDP-sugar pyrophosphorylase family protein
MALTLVVMAAGLGTRFGGPKQLAPVGPSGETLLDYAIYDAVRAGFTDAVLVIRDELADVVRAHVERVIADAVPVRYVVQRLEGPVPAGRQKPWGTAHAVLAARHEVPGSFAVCNADDFYGPGAYRLLAEHLTHDTMHALVGYRLDGTLSPHGGVSRAVVRHGPDGLLQQILEMREVRHTDGALVGTSVTGARLALTGAELVSMNLWGFTPAVLPVLADQFSAFRAAADAAAEFLLSTALNDQVRTRRAQLRVCAAGERWLGITFAQDVPAARAALAELVRAGTYPPDLRAAFANL